MSIDTIGDFLTIIRNGVMVSRPDVVVQYSRLKHEIAKILKEEGFVKDIMVLENDHKQIKIILKYVEGESVIHEINRISKPGRRIYTTVGNIRPVIGGLGISILTTSKGLMTNKKAKNLALGGELICTVW